MHLYPKAYGFNTRGPNGVRINRQPFDDNKVSGALDTLLHIVPNKTLLFFRITDWTMGKYNAVVRESVFEVFFFVIYQEKLRTSV